MGSVRTAGADTASVDALVAELQAAHRAIAAAQAWEAELRFVPDAGPTSEPMPPPF